MAVANFSLGQVNITQYLLVIAREVADPSTEAARLTFAPPHPTTRNVTFPNLNPTNHYFDFRSSADGADLGTLLATYTIDVGKITDVIIKVKEFVVDRGLQYDPVDGEDTYNNPDIIGQTYVVFKPGFGPLSFDENINDLPTGGFKYIDGQKFEHNERYTLVVFEKVVTQTSDTGRSFPLDEIDLDADTDLGPDHFNKLMTVSGAGNLITLTFPAFTSIPNGTKFGFNTHKATRRYLVLDFPDLAYCYVNGVQRNTLYLGKGEDLVIIKRGGVMRIEHWDGDHRRVGEQVHTDKAPINGAQEIGGWHLNVDYPRLFNWHINELDPSILGAATYPDTPDAVNITKWIISGDHFWFPDTGGYFYRNTDPNGDMDTERPADDRKSGTNQSSANLAHSHNVIARATTDAGVGALVGGTPNATTDGNQDSSISGGAESRPRNVNLNSYRII